MFSFRAESNMDSSNKCYFCKQYSTKRPLCPFFGVQVECFHCQTLGKLKISLVSVRCESVAVVVMETEVQRIVAPMDTAPCSRRRKS